MVKGNNIKTKIDEMSYSLQKVKNKKSLNSNTFLDIIKKGDREVYVTEILAYLLRPTSAGNNTCVRLLAKMLNLDIADDVGAQVITNKYAGGDFIDIFIEIPRSKAVIVLENKIWSGEHNHQTQHYYEYCEKAYSKMERRYMYLKPTCHVMEQPYCNIVNKKQIYNVVTYTELVEKVLESVKKQEHNDQNYQRILEDFITHCKRRFSMQKMLIDDDTKVYLENLEAIRYLENKYNEKMKYIKTVVGDCVTKLGYEKQPADKDEVYRFRKKDWSNYIYYLYFEVKYNDNNLNNVVCQLTLRNYTNSRKGKNDQDKFSTILDSLKDFPVHSVEYDDYYIFAQEPITCNELISLETYISNITRVLKKFAEQAERMFEIIKIAK